MKCEIIAEFCQNHNGDYVLLQEMIHRAAEAGAAYGKIQSIFASDLSFRDRFESGQEVNGQVTTVKRPYATEYERLKALEVSYEDHERFIVDCNKFGLIPLTTCFTRGSIPKLARLGWRSIKVASYDCGSLPLVRELAANFTHLFVSTGASYDEEIEATARAIGSTNATFTLLHCVTIYPTPLPLMNLKRMEYLRRFTSSVGFSNHALVSRDGVKADLAAIFLGANVIERHFTILPSEKTKDGPVSVGPRDVAEIVAFSRMDRTEQARYIEQHVPEFESMIGVADRPLSQHELVNRDYYRGRFATHVGNRVIFNWDDIPLG